MCPRQILELGKQFNLMICLQNILKASLQDVLKMSWRRLEDAFKTSWRRLEDVLKTFLQNVFWRRMTKANTFVLIKTSSRRLLKTKTKYVFRMSSSRRICLLGYYYYCTITLYQKYDLLLSYSFFSHSIVYELQRSS